MTLASRNVEQQRKVRLPFAKRGRTNDKEINRKGGPISGFEDDQMKNEVWQRDELLRNESNSLGAEMKYSSINPEVCLAKDQVPPGIKNKKGSREGKSERGGSYRTRLLT